jgi:hypothetical protein
LSPTFGFRFYYITFPTASIGVVKNAIKVLKLLTAAIAIVTIIPTYIWAIALT